MLSVDSKLVKKEEIKINITYRWRVCFFCLWVCVVWQNKKRPVRRVQKQKQFVANPMGRRRMNIFEYVTLCYTMIIMSNIMIFHNNTYHLLSFVLKEMNDYARIIDLCG